MKKEGRLSHDDIIDFLDREKLGFGAGLENTTGKQVVKALADTFSPVPSLEWIRAQFWPRNVFHLSSSSPVTSTPC